jgi:hypothetical protein
VHSHPFRDNGEIRVLIDFFRELDMQKGMQKLIENIKGMLAILA